MQCGSSITLIALQRLTFAGFILPSVSRRCINEMNFARITVFLTPWQWQSSDGFDANQALNAILFLSEWRTKSILARNWGTAVDKKRYWQVDGKIATLRAIASSTTSPKPAVCYSKIPWDVCRSLCTIAELLSQKHQQIPQLNLNHSLLYNTKFISGPGAQLSVSKKTSTM